MCKENNLYNNFYDKLISENLICDNDKITINKIHPIRQHNNILYHHIVTIENQDTKYFIRTIKEKDYSCSVTNSLNLLNHMFGKEIFSRALTAPFIIENQAYIITSYLEGENLESQMDMFSNDELIDLSCKIDAKLQLLHTITNNKYSYGTKFESTSFADVMCRKFDIQFRNPQNIFSKNIDIDGLLDKIKLILSHSYFSKPTLVHMDLKPANIIVSPSKEVYLIDFELSRFADLDYEWANLLIKTIHAYDERFKQYVLDPIIKKNFLLFDKAIPIEKYQIYLLYLSINKYIYCSVSKTTCPKAIIDLANYLISELNQ